VQGGRLKKDGLTFFALLLFLFFYFPFLFFAAVPSIETTTTLNITRIIRIDYKVEQDGT